MGQSITYINRAGEITHTADAPNSLISQIREEAHPHIIRDGEGIKPLYLKRAIFSLKRESLLSLYPPTECENIIINI